MISARGYVIDASIVVKWIAPEPFSETAVTLRSAPLHAPDLLTTDCANILWKKGRRGEMTWGQVEEAIGLLQHADIGLHATRPLLGKITELSRMLDHPAHDCAYLATAWLLELPLVTADARLARVVGGAGVDGAKLPAVVTLGALAL